MTNKNTDILASVDKFLEEYLVKRAPALPKKVKQILVDYGPYAIIISIVFAVPSILAFAGLNRVFNTYGFVTGRFGYFSTFALISLVSLGLEIAAVPGLLAKKLSAWKLLYWANWVNLLHSLLTLNLLSFIIGGALSFYILFQLKPLYK